MNKTRLRIAALTATALISFQAPAQPQNPDPNFFIYLSIGQSNMEAGARPEEIDKVPVDPRFQMMAAVDMPNLNRQRNNWYPADCPLCRQETGLGPTDWFGRTMVASLPEKYRVGVINVSVAGAKIEIFDEDVCKDYIKTTADWLQNMAANYDNNPYRRLVEIAEEAQKYGVIKGLLIHQGESNAEDPEWPSKVKKIYDRLVKDLNLNPKDFFTLAGELKYKEQNGTCFGFNTTILNKLPETLKNSYVISAKGCEGTQDPWHFSAAGYRELGKRYAIKALELQKFPYKGEGEVYAPDMEQKGDTRTFGRSGRTGMEDFVSTLYIPNTNDVVFLYRGKDAQNVKLSGQFLKEPVEMEKGFEGIWFTKQTIDKKDIYPYNFIVDGVTVSDPAARTLFPNEGFKASLLEMPDESALYTIKKDIPHGKVSYVTYWSDIMNENRTFLVYTPAGYETSGKSYPVFYLISGTTDTEETWFKVGRTNTIADNLIAAGEAKEMIIVMPYGNMGLTPRPASFEASEMYAKFGRELTECIMPVVEKEFRTIAGPQNRAIAGFSRGGGQSLFTAYSHPELFSWVCSYSAYLTPEVMDHFFTGISWAPREFEAQYRLMWFGVGSEDFLFNDVTRHREYFDSKGIHYQYLQTTGGHTWMNARTYLATTLRLLFK